MTTVPLPCGICVDCQINGAVMIHASGKMAIYCPHNRAGAVLQATTDESSLWTIYTPLSREEFTEAIATFQERYRARRDRDPPSPAPKAAGIPP